MAYRTNTLLALTILTLPKLCHAQADAGARDPSGENPLPETRDTIVTGPITSAEVSPGRGDVAPGIFRTSVPGAVRTIFELDGSGTELIGATADTDDPEFGSFSPVCATPCALWFNPGRHVIQLGSSLLRERQFHLIVDDRPKRVRFTRDNVPGIIAGVAIAGLGLIGMIFALPSTATDPSNAPIWWGVAGGGLALLGSGSALTFAMFGYSDWAYAPETLHPPVETAPGPP